MRYHLESTLPIHAFNPLGGRHSPFKHGMTLEGGGGGGIVSAITDPISDALGTSGDGGGLLGALADVDKAVGDTVPGGWGTIAAVAVPFAAPAVLGPLTAIEAAALAAGTSATTGAIQGKPLEEIALNAALAGGASYGLNSLFSGAEGAPNWDADITAGAEGYANAGSNAAIQLPSETPYVDLADAGTELTTPQPSYTPEIPPVNIPAELDLNALYVDLPDGATQLSYSPEVIASSTVPQNLTEEQLKEKFFNELINNPQNTAAPVFDYSTPASAETEKMVQTGMLDRVAELPGAAYDMAKSYVVANPYTSAALGLGALSLASGMGQQPQPEVQGQPVITDSRYTGGYGSSGGIADPYLLRNRVNAQNVYQYENPYNRYASVNRYANGGEVKHFAFGGISNALTRTFQPVEKAVLQPIGQAVPFIREVAPYAGILAAPFIGSPIAAAGIGGLSSGFGRPGSGFDMKRALMGGIAAYGASTLGAGLEAAGGPDPNAISSGVPNFDADITATVRNPSLNEAVSKPFFRDAGAMGRGVENLLSPSTYDQAAAQFGTKAGIYKTGVPLIIGTSGMMAVDEAQKMKEDADRAAAASKGEQQDMLARIAKGKKRAEEAVRANPYMYAVGGSVDDELGGDYTAMGMDQGNMQKGLFGLGYAAGGSLALRRLSQPAFNEGAVGGMPQFAEGGTPRFLSGGGDGMSDSIPATINGTQEARLADGEFVIPADVVSHLGNGSSKAGAKQLYSMMDRVRKARTGNKKQGRQIKPSKLMPA